MPPLISFEECIARPNENGQHFLLKDHLLAVKSFMEKKFEVYDLDLIKLVGLAGLCHDIAKSQYEWQIYANGRTKKGPTHSPLGAFFFSFFGYKLLKKTNKWRKYNIYWLWLTRDIADHHGQLKKLSNNHWIGAGQWGKMDLKGVIAFIKEQYTELTSLELGEDVLEDWAEGVFDVFEEALDSIDLGYSNIVPTELMQKLVFWREMTTSLISGDRFHVNDLDTTWFKVDRNIFDENKIDAFCRKNSSQSFSVIRQKAQQKILKQLEGSPDQMIYTLEMPTGYGKTITALKLASWLINKQNHRKIIYVAPYLSILEQTSQVIEEVLHTLVLEHHSLAILEQDNIKIERDEKTKPSQLMMESWASPLVCTSFQQFSKALFPFRAQDTLRRVFLQDSIIIIDEPQIFSVEYWNIFLCALEAMSQFYNLRIFFLSATMPSFDYGLSQKPTNLSIKPERKVERYCIVRKEKMDERQIADFMCEREEKTQAVILNTIEDAYRVYTKMKDYHPNLRLLHGMMVPLHKRIEIAKIQEEIRKLKSQEAQEICVVSTQIIEAGVDLSFEHIVRALPILPAVIQAAGRVNRHFEKPCGTLSLVPFLRGGEKDTRSLIYNPNLLRISDDLLNTKEIWYESEMLELNKKYYEKMFEFNSFETSKQAIVEAYQGNWPELSKVQPFGMDYFKLPIFVPWVTVKNDRKWLPKQFIKLQNRLRIYLPEDIYEYYEDPKFYMQLSFEEKKEFMILFNHYVINVPAKLAFSLVDKEIYLQNKIPMLLETESYSQQEGLAKRYVDGFDNII